MFYDYSQEHLDLEKIQISILEKKNQHGNLKEKLIIFEQPTLFEDTLIKVVTHNNDKIKTSYHHSSEERFKEKIFGKENQYDN